MAPINPTKLRPSDLIRLANSTARGEVLTEAVLRRQRMKAGFQIGDQRTINLLKYTGWLTTEYLKPAKETQTYDDMKEAARQRNAEKARAGRDIGDIPAVVNPTRKAKALKSFKYFCQVYFPDVFYLPFSADHETVIEKIEQAVLHGGLFALAMPRGSGKTCLMQMACVWAALSGNTEFVCLVAASGDRAKDLLENIKVWFETNPLLYEDFPEVAHPVQALEGIVNRQKGQLYQGQLTRIEWAADKLVLPTIAGSKASGVVISCSGLKGSDIRGQNHARPDGKVVRPSLVMIDDPQTTESAWSQSQSQRREAILAGDVLGMAGPGKKISGLMACTIIRPDDMADKILDRDKHPDWKGQRTKMVYAFPTHEKLWAEYAEIRGDSLRNDGNGTEATDFYRQNREAMDDGAIIAWHQRFNDDELSAIQHAMNLKFRDEGAFFAEYQNEPIVESQGDEMLSVEEICKKLNGYDQHIIPLSCNYLTLFIDVQKHLLFYLLAAWEENFTGYVIDYGVWPEQKRPFFTLREINYNQGLMAQKPGAGLEGALYHAMDQLTAAKLGQPYRRADGLEMHVNRCLIDANWGESTDVVYQFCKQSPHARILLPSHGVFVGASSTPFSEYRRKKGDRVGHHWRIPNTTGKRATRHVLIDANYWKSFMHARLSVAMADDGCLSLFGHQPQRHEVLAGHLTAEYKVKTTGRGREVDEWKLKATRPDNHWLDCLVGVGVAASIEGVKLFGIEPDHQRKKPVKLSDLQRQRSRR